ncbi:hypothetical protein MTO96_041671 [Rhipicephalus appendiculatus]|uniref:8 kDa Amblyomma family member n=1 Tax=Rhipicephalus appendiculatus TaxID=34631 RepID=A0A131YVK0_RHIAP
MFSSKLLTFSFLAVAILLIYTVDLSSAHPSVGSSPVCDPSLACPNNDPERDCHSQGCQCVFKSGGSNSTQPNIRYCSAA